MGAFLIVMDLITLMANEIIHVTRQYHSLYSSTAVYPISQCILVLQSNILLEYYLVFFGIGTNFLIFISFVNSKQSSKTQME